MALDPLSSEMDGMAPSHPVDPSAPMASSDESPIKVKGRMPASTISSNPVQPSEEDRSPASDTTPSAPAQDDPFAQAEADIQAKQQAAPAPDATPAANDDPFAQAEADIQSKAAVAPPASNPVMRQVIDTNLAAHRALNPAPAPGAPQSVAPQDPIHDFVHGMEAGLQISVSGLGIRGKMPDTILPEQADMAMRIGNQIGTLAGDLPAMAAGLMGGAAAGTVSLPVVGTVGLGAAGAFAAPPAIRKLLMDHIEGKQGNTRDFVASLMASTWEGIKGGATGLAATATGGLAAPVAGKLAGMGAELVAMTTVGSALEGHLPHPQDFIDGAIVLGGLHGLGHVTGFGGEAPTDAKLRNIYAATGETPAQIIEQAQKDVELKQQMIVGNMQEPPQATPTTLEHRTIWGTPVPGKVDLMSPGVALRLPSVPEKTLTLENGSEITLRAEMVPPGQEFPAGGDMPGVAAYNAQGERIGRLPIGGEFRGTNRESFVHTSGGTEVSPEMRRQGVASAMYDYANEHITPLEPSDMQTDEGAAFSKAYEEKKAIQKTQTSLIPKTDEEMGITEPAPKSPPEKNLSDLSEDARAIQETLSKLGENGEAPGRTWKQAFSDWYANSVDYLEKWKDAESQAKARGAEITPENSAENAARGARGWSDKAATFMADGTEDAATGKINGEGVDKIFSDLTSNGGDLDNLRAYGMNKNALEEFEKHGRTPWENFKPEDAQRVVKALGPEYEEYNQRLIDFGNRILDWAADKGRYSEDQVAQWKADHEFYSPQSRAFDADLYSGESPPSGGAIKSRTGSERAILDPIAQRIINTERIVKNVMINDARSKLVENLDAGGLVDKDGKWAETAFDPPLKIVSGEEGRIALAKGAAISVFDDGERTILTGSQGLIDSMKRLDGDATATDMVSKILRGFTNTLRIGVVSNPAFGLAHFTRGQFMAAVNSKTGLVPFVEPLMTAADIWMNKPEDFRQFISQGGGSGRYLDNAKSYMETDLAKYDNEKAPWQDQAWNIISKPFQASEAFIRLTDTATKFTEYRKSLANGAGTQEALDNARLVTPDYANVGLQRSILRTGVAFIGAHINSLDNLGRVIERDPVGALTKLSVISFMSTGLWALNKNDEAIDAVPDWQKNTYWNINVSRFSPDYKGPQDATIVKIPKPWAPGILFGSGMETALDAWFKPRPSEFPHFMENLMHSVVPEVMPNILQPVLDQYSNKQAFTGRPLVPEYKQKLLPEMQYSPYTSETAKAIGKLIGYVPLVKDLGPSTDPLASPDIVENYIKSWGGTLGGWALKTSDWTMRGGKDSGKAEPWEDTPFLRQFVSRYPSFQDQRLQDFYENRDEADKAYNSMKAATKAGDFDAAERIRQAHPDFEVRLDAIAKGISTARRTFSNIQDDPNIPAVEKRQNLDTILFQIGSMAKEGNQMMNDFKHGPMQNSAKAGGQ